MSHFYLPQTPASAEALRLPDVNAPYLAAEAELNKLAFNLETHIKLDPNARKEAPIGLVSTQKLEQHVRDIKDHREEDVQILTGTSPSGRSFMALYASDQSVLMGQVNPRSGMVKVFPFPLVAKNGLTAKAIASEFDVWEALCDAAPKLHLNEMTAPAHDWHKIPTWLAASLLDYSENRPALRALCGVALTVFWGRHKDLKTTGPMIIQLHSRRVRRDGTLTDPVVSLQVDGTQSETLQRKFDDFAVEFRRILDGPACPVSALKQVATYTAVTRDEFRIAISCLAQSEYSPENLSAHELMEANATWAELLRQST